MFLHNMHIYQLKITLMDVRSLIWRLLRVGCENVPQYSPFVPPQMSTYGDAEGRLFAIRTGDLVDMMIRRFLIPEIRCQAIELQSNLGISF